jgi:hypothetical protein
MASTYLSARLIGKDKNVKLSTDAALCGAYAGDSAPPNVIPQSLLTEIVVVTNPRTDENNNVTGYDLLNFSGRACAFAVSEDNKTLTRRAAYDHANYQMGQSPPKTAKKFTFKCDDTSVIAEAGISNDFTRFNVRCQDLQSTEEGAQLKDAMLYDEANNIVPDDFVLGLNNTEIESRTRCEDGDAPYGFYRSLVDDKLNSFAFKCAKLPVALPVITGEPAPVDKMANVLVEEAKPMPINPIVASIAIIPIVVSVVTILILVGIVLGIVFGVRRYRRNKAALLAATKVKG